MKEKELKERLERSLQKEIPLTAWKKLCDGGWVQDYRLQILVDGPEQENFKALRKQAKTELDYLEEYKRELAGLTALTTSQAATEEKLDTGRDEDRSEYLQPDLGDYEKERRQALSEQAARMAEAEPTVVDFRRTYLAGQVLDPDQAYSLLKSPAASYLPAALFADFHLPLQHKAEILNYDRATDKPEPDHRITIEVSPPGAVYTVQYAPRDPTVEEDPSVPGVNYRVFAYEDGEYPRPKSPNSWHIQYRGSHGLKNTAFTWPGSLLDQLRVQSKWLAGRYGWEEEDAVWFILTGTPPKLSVFKLGVQFTGRRTVIKLEVAPWVSADMVKDNYQKTQRQVLTKGVRELPLRSLAVFRFVEREIRKTGRLPPWPDLLDTWNRENPQWAYSDFRGLRQAYQRTRNKLLPSYKLPRSKPLTPEAKAEIEARTARLMRSLQVTLEREKCEEDENSFDRNSDSNQND